MRLLMMLAAMASVSACNRGGSANNSSGNQTKAAVADNLAPVPAGNAASASANNASAAPSMGRLPADFPSADPVENGMNCYVYLSLSMQAQGAQAGYDAVAMEQSRDQWRSALRQSHSEEETNQLTASNLNPLMGTPAARRDAAANWCVQNAPEVDPEG